MVSGQRSTYCRRDGVDGAQKSIYTYKLASSLYDSRIGHQLILIKMKSRGNFLAVEISLKIGFFVVDFRGFCRVEWGHDLRGLEAKNHTHTALVNYF